MVLLCGHSEHTGATDLPGAQSLEERVGVVGRFDDFTILDGDPLTLKALQHLGQTERFHDPALCRISNYTVVIHYDRSVHEDGAQVQLSCPTR